MTPECGIDLRGSVELVTRETQVPGVLYVVGDDYMFVVAPDGGGRYWYNSVEEATCEHGFLTAYEAAEVDD